MDKKLPVIAVVSAGAAVLSALIFCHSRKPGVMSLAEKRQEIEDDLRAEMHGHPLFDEDYQLALRRLARYADRNRKPLGISMITWDEDYDLVHVIYLDRREEWFYAVPDEV